MKTILGLCLLLSLPVYAEETMTLNTPVVVDPRNATAVKIYSLNLNWGSSPANSSITISLSDGTINKNFTYTGSTARTLINSLNTMNFSTVSLEKRIYNRLIADGYLNGTVIGSPDQ